uniref:Uncharacterized protein n=1 Tax=Glossina palpalis gambiensis TaxID=67801 RepID=A0A1B0AW78_9MUSC
MITFTFRTLKGEKGERGAKGPPGDSIRGPPGPPGPKGEPGTSAPFFDFNSNPEAWGRRAYKRQLRPVVSPTSSA